MSIEQSVRIVDYDPAWPMLFARECSRLQAVIGPWTAGIEHMGSTSVKGLAGKRIIDLLVGVHALQDADTYCKVPIGALGYTYVQAHEVHFPKRRFFQKSDAEGQRTHHIHLVQIASPFWHEHLLFRDLLRAHPQVAAAYAAHKRSLAPQFQDTNAYATAKGPFIRDVLAQARRWQAR